MATRTLGTNLTTSLTAIRFGQDLLDADIASVVNAILDDRNMGQVAYNATGYSAVAPRIFPGAFSRAGLLYVPNRGTLKVMPGDYVAVDASGWPILISNNAINTTVGSGGPASSWTHT